MKANFTLIALMATATSGVMAGELLNKRDTRLAQAGALHIATGDDGTNTLHNDLKNIWKFLGGDSVDANGDPNSWVSGDLADLYEGSKHLLEHQGTNGAAVDTAKSNLAGTAGSMGSGMATSVAGIVPDVQGTDDLSIGAVKGNLEAAAVEMFELMTVFHFRLDHQQKRLVEVEKALSSSTEAAGILDYDALTAADPAVNF